MLLVRLRVNLYLFCSYHVSVCELSRAPTRNWFAHVLMKRDEYGEEDEEDGRVATVQVVDEVIVTRQFQLLDLRQTLDQREHADFREGALMAVWARGVSGSHWALQAVKSVRMGRGW